jgi:hypothetical protein
VDRSAELAAIAAHIAAHGVRHCPTACVAPVPYLFEPLLIAQKLAALRLPPAKRPSWIAVWVARMREENHAWRDGVSLREYRTARAAPVAQG